jgi:hypothetical protein
MLGLIYNGSKRKIAPEVLNVLQLLKPEATNLIDMFGGGAAITLSAAEKKLYKKYYYNDISFYIKEFLQYHFDNGNQMQPWYYEWFDKGGKIEVYKNKDAVLCLHGFLLLFWTFGVSNNDFFWNYTYNKWNMLFKKCYHKILFGEVCSKRIEYYLNYLKEYKFEPIAEQSLEILQSDEHWKVRFSKNKALILSYLYSKYPRFCKRGPENRVEHEVYTLLTIGYLYHLNRLEHLEKICKLEKSEIDKISFNSFNYKEFPLEIAKPAESIVYCDIPYTSTSGKNCNDHLFDVNEFLKWIKKYNDFTFLINNSEPLEGLRTIGTKQVFKRCNNKLLTEYYLTNIQKKINI